MYRPPIIVVLGHVDHGKTTLLDYLRKSHIADKEAGGITQHIRSFQYKHTSGDIVTFIDTPGHAAFSQMRSRGSQIADLAILIIAADDGVMPQTIQSIEFIKSSQLPFVVAFNKTDLPSADIEKAKIQLSQNSILVEGFGGDVPAVSISAKTGKGIDELLEVLLLLWQLKPEIAKNDNPLCAYVLESRLDAQKGPLATIIIKQGTLKTGQELFQSAKIGKVKSLVDADGNIVKEAFPSQPVEILGLSQVPSVGSQIFTTITPENSSSAINATQNISDPTAKNIIIKSDVVGSLEAITENLRNKNIKIIDSATGDVSESDILLARTSNAEIIAFNVKVSGQVAKLAEVEKVTINEFNIIYKLFEFIDKHTQKDEAPPITGQAQIIAEFKINSDHIAGCKVTQGILSKDKELSLLRNEKVISHMKFKSLQIGKNQTDKVKVGQEFGAQFSPQVDFKTGDCIITTG